MSFVWKMANGTTLHQHASVSTSLVGMAAFTEACFILLMKFKYSDLCILILVKNNFHVAIFC